MKRAAAAEHPRRTLSDCHRGAHREIARLRAALGEMVDEAEQIALASYWPWVDHPPGKPRLCAILARQMSSYELAQLKCARRALGLPWWENLP